GKRVGGPRCVLYHVRRSSDPQHRNRGKRHPLILVNAIGAALGCDNRSCTSLTSATPSAWICRLLIPRRGCPGAEVPVSRRVNRGTPALARRCLPADGDLNLHVMVLVAPHSAPH